ncbi:hypothetical protein CPLU01_05761 [Colletotrichum plurivorum]|uniref:Uncharacterized protein n=1 Tax=Colletotrichum plurivorum TaxID=2175906 RepID=A0A8H6KKA5_9PEZI|nr:hypothetical protein CPLU01_05761 [Colletotrichum plurivorum]
MTLTEDPRINLQQSAEASNALLPLLWLPVLQQLSLLLAWRPVDSRKTSAMLLHDGFSSPEAARLLTALADRGPIRPRIKVRGKDKDLKSPFAEMVASADKELGHQAQVGDNDVSSRAPNRRQQISSNTDYGAIGVQKGYGTGVLDSSQDLLQQESTDSSTYRGTKLKQRRDLVEWREQGFVHAGCHAACTHYQRRMPGSLATSTKDKPLSFWNAQTQLQPADPTDKDGFSHDDAAKGR